MEGNIVDGPGQEVRLPSRTKITQGHLKLRKLRYQS